MNSLTILELEKTAKDEGRKANIQGVLMSDGWHYWDSNSLHVEIAEPVSVKAEPVSDYW